MSAHNRVVWSEGLFLQPQHFQQQDRYFERYVETRCQALIALQLGLHRDRARTRSPEHRQVRAAPRRGRVSGRHAVPDARRRSAAAADRHRRGRARSDACIWRCRCAGPASSTSTARSGGRSGAARSARARGARRHVGGGDPAVLEVGALRTRLLLRERRRPRRMPACRWRTSSNAAPTSRWCSTTASFRRCCSARAATRLATFDDRAARPVAPARRCARRPRRGDRPGRGGGDRRLPDAAGDQPLRAAAGALRRLRRRCIRKSSFSLCVAAAGELATFTTTSKRPPQFPGYRHDRLRESFEPVIAALRDVAERGARPDGDSDSARAEEVRDQRRDRGRSNAVQHRRVHPGGARRRAGRRAAPAFPGAAQDRAGRKDPRPGEAAAARRAGASRCRWRRGRFRFTRGSPTSSWIRPTSCGTSSRPRAASPCTSPASFPG